jgi:hypothetical protein
MPDWAPRVRARLASLHLSPTRENEIVEDSQHLDERYRELLAGGTSPDEATYLALEDFQSGDVLARQMASLRQAHVTAPTTLAAPPGHVLSDLWRDLRYAGRMLRRHPIWTATATLSLAVGIGLHFTLGATAPIPLLQLLDLTFGMVNLMFLRVNVRCAHHVRPPVAPGANATARQAALARCQAAYRQSLPGNGCRK